MIGDQYGLEKPRAIAITNPSFFYRPAWSPDGKYIAFTDTHFTLWYVEVQTGAVKKADAESYAHVVRTMNPVWSPDGKWIAYARLLNSQFKAIFVYHVETGKKYQVTDGLADAIDPVWDASGRYLYFLASTDFALNSAWLDMSKYSIPVTRGLYVAVLAKNGASPFLPRSDEEGNKEQEAIGKKDSVVS